MKKMKKQDIRMNDCKYKDVTVTISLPVDGIGIYMDYYKYHPHLLGKMVYRQLTKGFNYDQNDTLDENQS